MADCKWLRDIIVINDSRGIANAGDVTLFRSAGEACRYVEPWWVKEDQGFVLTADGQKVTLGIDGRDVIVRRYEDFPDGRAIVLRWLQYSAQAILTARRHKAQSGKILLGETEASGILPATVEGLIAYIGFAA
ncbi:hypothetical protein GRI38_10815 [Altererythrobacter aurantiacus]|uniref:Uncharacterized protein n=1 Tax=Parapontixanthobacter aurantiacus TaxID=1463599 RepID=A0A844ZH98_9SPHN|nr:hypothetical protein [Parapontixanthobacter aurantiacus]MXO86516.1 hypothetical protein [Parapontixanthobacter aurantiacus]